MQDEIYSLNQKTGIAAIIDGMANTSDVAQDVVKLESAKQRAKEVFANVQKATTLRNASYNAAIDDIYRKLQNGDLVAKGFLIPIDINSEEIIIPASRWRFLKFNKDFTEASGEGIEYKAIAVARRS